MQIILSLQLTLKKKDGVVFKRKRSKLEGSGDIDAILPISSSLCIDGVVYILPKKKKKKKMVLLIFVTRNGTRLFVEATPLYC
ncbi:hypothetical protein T09_13167 [Trichinella sp. T9]|nr:hypothetical protein T09_13167 [Trichinella sp. T9]